MHGSTRRFICTKVLNLPDKIKSLKALSFPGFETAVRFYRRPPFSFLVYTDLVPFAPVATLDTRTSLRTASGDTAQAVTKSGEKKREKEKGTQKKNMNGSSRHK